MDCKRCDHVASEDRIVVHFDVDGHLGERVHVRTVEGFEGRVVQLDGSVSTHQLVIEVDTDLRDIKVARSDERAD